MARLTLSVKSYLLVFFFCGFISLFSIVGHFYRGSEFRKTPATNPQPVIEISTNDNIRAVWDSGLYSARNAGVGIYWLDNDTIVVSANNGPKPITPEQSRQAKNLLYIWRLGNKPTPYGEDPRVAALGYYCAARGEITYYKNVVDPRTGALSKVRLLGPPGREREVAAVVGRPVGGAANTTTIERTDCEIYADPAMAGKVYVTDSEHRYYLDFGKEPGMAAIHAKPAEPIALMRADGSGRVELPISNAQAGEAYFHTFDNVFYLLNGQLGVSPINDFETWRATNCWPIWRVDPQTAAIDRLCIPFGPWSGAINGRTATSLLLVSTRAGLFFAANPVGVREDHGFYRLLDGAVSSVLPGYVWSPSVSPNGCRVAFVYLPSDDAYRPFSSVSSRITVVDLCSPWQDTSPSLN